MSVTGVSQADGIGCRIRKIMANWLLSTAVVVSSLLLCAGLTAALYDIEQHGWGLYLILVSIVSFMMISAFCLIGTEAQKESIAHQFWESTRHTVRKYTPMLNRQAEPGSGTGGALLTLANATSMRFTPDNVSIEHGQIDFNFLTPPSTARELSVTFVSPPSSPEDDDEEEVQL